MDILREVDRQILGGKFAYNLNHYLRKQNITQKELAHRTSISLTAINNYAQGRVPETYNLCKIAAELNLSLDCLLIELNTFYAPLDDKEQDLLENLRLLPPDRRKYWFRKIEDDREMCVGDLPEKAHQSKLATRIQREEALQMFLAPLRETPSD